MLLIDKQYIDKASRATSPREVSELLNGAVLLELSTLPPYLTGAFSLAPGANDEVRALVMSVALEEMLHMALAANTTVAVGGDPTIFTGGRALRYPGGLPMGVEKSLTVSLGSLTIEQTQSVFMEIERPDTQATLPGESGAQAQQLTASKAEGYGSIGDFYAAIIAALERLEHTGKNPFANPRLERQLDLSKWFARAVSRETAGKVFDMESARAALELIVRQGEGVQVGKDPIDPHAGEAAFAHYFRFGEIAFGRRLVPDAKATSGWSYSGERVPYDATKVYTFPANAKVSDYPQQSAARLAASAFYEGYLRLLRSLDRTFNGEPAAFDAALGVMFELKLLAQQIVRHPADPKTPDGPTAAPAFQP